MCVEIDPVHIVSATNIGDRVDSVGDVTPNPATVVAVSIGTIDEDRIAAFAALGIDSISGTSNQAGTFDQRDTSCVGVDGEVGLAICVQFSTRDRAESCLRKKDNLGERVGSCPCGLEGYTQVR